MILGAIKLQNFRCYKKTRFEFSPYTTLIVGQNTAGKTNILEAIYATATGKSFRAEIEKDMVSWGDEVGRVTVDTGEDQLELVVTTGLVGGVRAPTKKYLVNGVPRRMIDFVGRCKAVLFWPEDIELVTGSPGKRRRYLDSVLVQTDREYRRCLAAYEKGLRQRNKLLFMISEGIANRSQLMFWDHLLIKNGGYIMDTRLRFIEYLNTHLLSGVEHQIVYDKSVISEERLAKYADAEIGAKVTLVGPHRDDIFIQVKKELPRSDDQKVQKSEWRNLASFGSRGEQRLAVLWMKLGELRFITETVGDKPVLLLDDIFSELDAQHRDLVLALVKEQQTIITSAEEESVQLVETLGIKPHVIHLAGRT